MSNTLILDDDKLINYSKTYKHYLGIKKIIVKTSSITKIENNTFTKFRYLEEVELSDSITSLGDNIFDGCTNLKKVKLSQNITNMPFNAFRNCIQLEKIDFPISIKYIAGNAFDGCINLKKVKLNEGLLEIYEGAFIYCESLESITIPNSVKKISHFAFNYCPNLVEFKLSKKSKLEQFNLYTFGEVKSLNYKTKPQTISPFANILNLMYLNSNIILSDNEISKNNINFFIDITKNKNNILRYLGKFGINFDDISFLLDEKEYSGSKQGSNYGI